MKIATKPSKYTRKFLPGKNILETEKNKPSKNLVDLMSLMNDLEMLPNDSTDKLTSHRTYLKINY